MDEDEGLDMCAMPHADPGDRPSPAPPALAPAAALAPPAALALAPLEGAVSMWRGKAPCDDADGSSEGPPDRSGQAEEESIGAGEAACAGAGCDDARVLQAAAACDDESVVVVEGGEEDEGSLAALREAA